MGLTTGGQVRLASANIGGQFDLTRATLNGVKGEALNADRIKVDNHMILANGFSANGTVHLLGAHIGGQLILDGATLKMRRVTR